MRTSQDNLHHITIDPRAPTEADQMKLRMLCVVSALLFVAITIQKPVLADTLTVNGVCEVGPCGSPTIRHVGDTATIPFDFSYEFANTDLYHASGSIVETFQPGTLDHETELTNVKVTYEGNSTETSSHTDVLVAVLDAAYDYGFATPLSTHEFIEGEFGDGLGVGTSVSGQGTIFGGTLPLMGPITSPPQTFFESHTGTSSTDGTPGLDYFVYTLTFDPGTQIGASIFLFPTGPVDPSLPSGPTEPSTVPEPSTLTLFGTGLIGVMTTLKGRRSKNA
jgi:PEP-CTERM motif